MGKTIEYPDKPMSTENEFFGNGWSVRKQGDQYVLAFLSGEIASREKEIEISKHDFDSARSGLIDFDDLCTKYGIS